jgi:glutaredoxin
VTGDTTNRLTVYGARWCADCRRTKCFLDRHAVPYDYIDIDHDPQARQRARALQDGGHTIPVVVLANGSHLLEPTDDRLAARLA